jgi:hypothetical protein
MNHAVVIDANVLFKVVIREEFSERAQALYTDTLIEKVARLHTIATSYKVLFSCLTKAPYCMSFNYFLYKLTLSSNMRSRA